MRERMEALVREVFAREERNDVELRLSQEEARWLEEEKGAVCRALDIPPAPDGKRWYLVRMD